MTAEIDGEFVIYINGMRLNKLHAIHKYLLAGLKAAEMFDELEKDPDSGFLGYLPAYMGLRFGATIQYWRSLEDIRRFAQDPDDLHVLAWKWYNEKVGNNGELGFWAELYVIKDGNYETFYRNMHPIGLGEIGAFVHDVGPPPTTRFLRRNRTTPREGVRRGFRAEPVNKATYGIIGSAMIE